MMSRPCSTAFCRHVKPLMVLSRCESAWPTALGGGQRLRHKPCLFLACLSPQAALCSDDVQFPPLDETECSPVIA